MSLGVGQDFAGYTIARRLGAGGMGEVYLAQHPRLPKQVALKLLGSSISTDPIFRERFLREADLTSRLWHPHIVSVQDRGEDGDQLWIAMDYVDGEDAAELLSRRFPTGMPQELVVSIVAAVSSALDHAHEQGLLHRDVKPANILLTHVDDPQSRRILLTDFGIARESDEVSGLTQTNMTLGTVAYAAPEQLMGSDIDGRADQYALAATAYHLLTGAPMFPQTNPVAVIGHHLNSAPPSLGTSRPELVSLDPILAVALAKNPSDRFARCSDFADALAAQMTSSGGAGASFAPTAAAPIPSKGPAAPITNTASDAQLTGAFKPALLWGGVLLLGLIAAVAMYAFGRNVGGPASSAASSTNSRTVVSSSVPSTSTVTVSVLPPSTITKTVTPTAVVPTYDVPTQTRQSGGSVVVIGTCDEGGSCGVQQRTQPSNSAPRLYPNVLKDGTTVVVVCATLGDQRSSQGRGSSTLWYQLDNGAYINSVYLSPPRTELPAC